MSNFGFPIKITNTSPKTAGFNKNSTFSSTSNALTNKNNRIPSTLMVLNVENNFIHESNKKEYEDETIDSRQGQDFRSSSSINKTKMLKSLKSQSAESSIIKKLPNLASSFLLPKRPNPTGEINMVGRSNICTQTEFDLRKIRLNGINEYQKWSSHELDPFIKVNFFIYSYYYYLNIICFVLFILLLLLFTIYYY
jgi:hypothetical protein